MAKTSKKDKVLKFLSDNHVSGIFIIDNNIHFLYESVGDKLVILDQAKTEHKIWELKRDKFAEESVNPIKCEGKIEPKYFG